jgi:type IV secretory pathway TraG/TraD family ATPase VirD4
VYFSLEADRRPLLAKMLGAAIVTDLVSLAAAHQSNPVPTVVLIDEFPAIGAEHVASLFGRARSAGISLLLATQEFADLNAVGRGALREQAIGNVETVIAYRQNVPDSAELLAGIAGTRPAWITTQQTRRHLIRHGLTGLGTRTRGHEYVIHPYRVKQLATGQALVITPTTGARPVITQIHHPSEAHR